MRHGETDWNRLGRLQGQRDVPLNPCGRDQAVAAGAALRRLLSAEGVEPSGLRFIASPLGRTRETMERLRTAMGLPAEPYDTDDRLMELAFGAWEGMTWRELKAAVPVLVRARKKNKWTFVPPGGESYAGLADRLHPWLTAVRDRDVVVAHGGVARVLMHLVAGVTITDAPDADIHQGRVLRFSPGRCDWVC